MTDYKPRPMENRKTVNFKLTDDALDNDRKLKTPQAPLDVQVGGDHYKRLAIQPVEFAMANNLNYCQANAIKYICRYKLKNGLEDLEKAKHYIDLLIQMEYNNEHASNKRAEAN